MQKSKLLTVWVETSLNVSETFKTVRRTGGLKIINLSCGTIPLILSLLYEKRGWEKINLIYFSPYLLNPSYLILNLLGELGESSIIVLLTIGNQHVPGKIFPFFM